MSLTDRLASAWESFKSPKPPAEERISNQVVVSMPMMPGRPQASDVDLRRMQDEGYRQNVVVHACIKEIASTAAEPPVVIRDRKTKEPWPEDHYLVRMFRQPHPDASKFALFESVLIDLNTSGNAYLHRGKNAKGETRRLTRLRPDRMSVVPEADGTVKGWVYKAREGDRGVFLPREDVTRFSYFDPMNDYYGLSPLIVAALWADLDWEMALYMLSYFRNGGVPAGILNVEGPSINPDERQRLMDEWATTFGRFQRQRTETGAHRLAILSGGKVSYQDVGTNPSKLQLDGVWGMSESRLCAIFGVPPVRVQVRVGLQSSTYANYEEAGRAFWRETMQPMYSRIDEVLTSDFAEELSEGDAEIVFDLEHISALAESVQSKEQRAIALYSGGLVTLQQAREIADLEPLDEIEEDIIVVPQQAKPVGEVGKKAEVPPALAANAGLPGQDPNDPEGKGKGEDEEGDGEPPEDDGPKPPEPPKPPRPGKAAAPEEEKQYLVWLDGEGRVELQEVGGPRGEYHSNPGVFYGNQHTGSLGRGGDKEKAKANAAARERWKQMGGITRREHAEHRKERARLQKEGRWNTQARDNLKARLARERAELEGKAAKGGGKATPVGSPGAPSSSPNAFASQESSLSTPGVSDLKNLGGGISETYLVNLEGGGKAVWKPAAGEHPGKVRETIPAGKGNCAKAEAGAWEVAKQVGMEDMVGACVLREVTGHGGAGGKGAMMQYHKGVDAARSQDPFDGRTDRARAAIFDHMIDNQDRHQGNWRTNDGLPTKIRLIDHGYSFGDTAYSSGGARSFISRALAGRAGHALASEWVKPYIDKAPSIARSLRGLGMRPSAVAAFLERVDHASALIARNPNATVADVLRLNPRAR